MGERVKVGRRRVGAVLLVVAGVLAAVASFQRMYELAFQAPGRQEGYSSSLTIIDVETGEVHAPLDDNGWLLIAVAVLLVVSGLVLLRNRTVAKALSMAAAGAITGILLSYLLMVRRIGQPATGLSSIDVVVEYRAGIYLWAAAAVAAIAGAVVAQLQERAPEKDVLIHEFTDDDTPPFGIAVPVVLEPKRE
ncbi:hypothetical protein BBK82_24700 [Lentzea guizhouensis]|uniref:Uncharacterized protein n=1 Tax=Lentzea guizhouensis TaxID=1586287 RepID=A0A1B2HM59_9PSEU|nr:hypothetical protein [Lentzea guizhouensis]ANZ38785.1 hypothetical protein BBK82_24700 [Lentzea guizhouensis]